MLINWLVLGVAFILCCSCASALNKKDGFDPDEPGIMVEPDTPLEIRLSAHSPFDEDELRDFFEEEIDVVGVPNELPLLDTQIVYVDFNNGDTYVVNVVDVEDGEMVGQFGPFESHFYTDEEKEEIIERLETDYSRFNVEFVTEEPSDGDYATIQLNFNDYEDLDGAAITIFVDEEGSIVGTAIRFGFADGIDFLNLVRDDLSRVDANFWEFLIVLDPSGSLFTTFTGISVEDDEELQEALSMVVINQSANTASHELGHNLGLRHHESFGAPGNGLPSTGTPSKDSFVPPYPGDSNADESLLHLLATRRSTGLPLEVVAQSDRFFSERSSIKLSFAEGHGNFLTEDDAQDAGMDNENGLEIPEFRIPNTIEEGENEGSEYLLVDAVVISGRIRNHGGVDAYRLFLKEDQFFDAEVISFSSTLDDRVITRLKLYRELEDESLVKVAENFQTFEPFDPLILDFLIPETGTYVLKVSAPDEIFLDFDGDGIYDDPVSISDSFGVEFLTGDYNLLVYSHEDPIMMNNGSQEPPNDSDDTPVPDNSDDTPEESHEVAPEESSEFSVAGTDEEPGFVVEPDTPLQLRLEQRFPLDENGLQNFFEEEAEVAGVSIGLPSSDTQIVYVDFNNGDTYLVNVHDERTDQLIDQIGPYESHFYTDEEQEEICSRLEKDYDSFNVKFVTEKPSDGDYSTLVFNVNDYDFLNGAAISVYRSADGSLRPRRVLLGLADHIDFLNLIRNDLARVDANIWEFLVEIDPSGAAFSFYTGIPVEDKEDLERALSEVVINQSANTGAHEVGHNLGLRHHESFGAPSNGLPDGNVPPNESFVPVYDGVRDADETTLHTMATAASVGITIQQVAQWDRFFSERSSIKLSLAEGCGNFMTEEDAKAAGIDNADGMKIPMFRIPNTIVDGDNEGSNFLRVDTVVIFGSISSVFQVDGYRLFLKAGRYFDAEIISLVSTLDNRVISRLTLYRELEDESLVKVAENFQTFEPYDPLILDYKVPRTGTYVLKVSAPDEFFVDFDGDRIPDAAVPISLFAGPEFLVGDYNLLVYNHKDPISQRGSRDDDEMCGNFRRNIRS